jgi:eukaryotic-like serine/threonine-protein kinase
MSSNHVDRNLLFGFLALQNNFIDREDLIAAVSAWLVDKSRTLGDILRERKALAEDEYQLVAALAAKHLERHANDPEKSLAALSTMDVLPQQLKQLGDPDLEASLNHVGRSKADSEPQLAETLKVESSETVSSRFRIMRPHAKGGLGQVFVAKDLELNRDVALKEIQLHHADDVESRARFVLEAEITGGLEHPGIVPVYGFGQYPDGRPYYAMRFIRGESLKETIERFHAVPATSGRYESVDFRNLLGRFISVCYAIEYAHSRGILHRDLKPGNIMLGRYGETLVVDWGLAKAKGRYDVQVRIDEQTLRPRSGSGSAATLMGSAVGTPAYMSPEQASGRLDRMGPASDVYSLAATLYSALTGQNPFPKGNAFTILHKVQLGEFLRPREVVAAVPKPLEAICLKGMALKPEERYGSASELAQDIERWLADEPVKAFPDTWSDRARRWGRRHRRLVQVSIGATVAIACIASAAAIAVSAALHREANAKQQSDEQFLLARNTMDRWLVGVSEALQYGPGMGAMRERLLQTAAKDYEKLLAYRSADPALELDRGRVLLRLGEVHRDLGDFRAASASFAAAEEHFEQLPQRLPGVTAEAMVERGRALLRRGDLANRQDDGRALNHWQAAVKAVEIPQPDTQTEFDRRLVLAAALLSIGQWFESAGQTAEARKELDAALEVLPTAYAAGSNESSLKQNQLLSTRVEATRLKAKIAAANGEWIEARRLLSQVFETLETATKDKRDEPRQMMTVAELQLDLAVVLHKAGLHEEALGAYGSAASIQRRLLEMIPDNPDYRESLALTLLDRQQLLTELQRMREAEQDLREAMTLITRLVELNPQVAQYQQELAMGLESQGRLAHVAGGFARARDALQQSIRIFQMLAEAREDVYEYRERAAVAQVQLGRAFEALKQPALADAEFDAAQNVLGELQTLAPDHAPFAVNMAWLHKHRGDLYWDRGQSSEATEVYRKSMAAWRNIVERWPGLSHDRGYAESLVNCPVVELRDPEQALTLARRVMEAASAEPLSRSLHALALVRAGRHTEALAALQEGGFPLARDLFVRAQTLMATGDVVGAQRAFDKATAMQSQRPGDEDLRRLAQETGEKLGLKPEE